MEYFRYVLVGRYQLGYVYMYIIKLGLWKAARATAKREREREKRKKNNISPTLKTISAYCVLLCMFFVF